LSTPAPVLQRRRKHSSTDSEISPIVFSSAKGKRQNVSDVSARSEPGVAHVSQVAAASQVPQLDALLALVNVPNYTMADFAMDLSQLNPTDAPVTKEMLVNRGKEGWALHQICASLAQKVAEPDIFKSLVLGGAKFDHVKRAVANMPGKDDDFQTEWDNAVDQFAAGMRARYITRLDSVGQTAKAEVNTSLSQFKQALVNTEGKSMEDATKDTNELGFNIIGAAKKIFNAREKGFDTQIRESAQRDARLIQQSPHRGDLPMDTTEQGLPAAPFRARAGSLGNRRGDFTPRRMRGRGWRGPRDRGGRAGMHPAGFGNAGPRFRGGGFGRPYGRGQ
jgi:hypothetical protein